jgi:exodeoxyribonuclease-3
MRVATWNVNSVRQRVARVKAWAEKRRPDVLCLQETKVVDEEFCSADFEGLGYRCATWGQKTYNGVAILSRSELTDVVRGLPGDPPDAPRRLLAGTVEGVRVVCVYVPNGESPESEKFVYKLEWLRRLDAWLRASSSPSDPLLLLGDFNVAPEERDVHDPDLWRGKVHFHPKEHEALGRIASFGLFDCFRKHHPEAGQYSWWDYRMLAFPRNHGLRIDLLLGTKPMLDRCSAAAMDREERKGEKPSDHVPVYADFGPA